MNGQAEKSKDVHITDGHELSGPFEQLPKIPYLRL